jgi:hypothetical protein
MPRAAWPFVLNVTRMCLNERVAARAPLNAPSDDALCKRFKQTAECQRSSADIISNDRTVHYINHRVHIANTGACIAKFKSVIVTMERIPWCW